MPFYVCDANITKHCECAIIIIASTKFLKISIFSVSVGVNRHGTSFIPLLHSHFDSVGSLMVFLSFQTHDYYKRNDKICMVLHIWFVFLDDCFQNVKITAKRLKAAHFRIRLNISFLVEAKRDTIKSNENFSLFLALAHCHSFSSLILHQNQIWMQNTFAAHKHTLESKSKWKTIFAILHKQMFLQLVSKWMKY